MKIDNSVFIEQNFDIDGLIESGFLKPELKGDYAAIEKRIKTFFGFDSIYQYHHIFPSKDKPVQAKNIFSTN